MVGKEKMPRCVRQISKPLNIRASRMPVSTLSIMPFAAFLTAIVLVPVAAPPKNVAPKVPPPSGPLWRYIAAGDKAMDPTKLDNAIKAAVISQIAAVDILAKAADRVLPHDACVLGDYKTGSTNYKALNYFMNTDLTYKYAKPFYAKMLGYRVWKLHDAVNEPDIKRGQKGNPATALINVHIAYWLLMEFCRQVVKMEPVDDGLSLMLADAKKRPNTPIGHHKIVVTIENQKLEIEADFEEADETEDREIEIKNAKVKVLT